MNELDNLGAKDMGIPLTRFKIEKLYANQPGVQVGVTLDGDIIEIQGNGGVAVFDTEDLGWLEDCLARIRSEIQDREQWERAHECPEIFG